uniref:Uncharacterized protein n=1 Tax=Oryza meridionalis TaxID=40149 RepID=A0A0E0CB14_9ORYZ
MASGALARLLLGRRAATTPLLARPFAAKARASCRPQEPTFPSEDEDDFAGGEVAAPAPTEGISKPLAEVLRELGKRVPEALVKTRVEDGFSLKYIPWHIVNKILNIHAPEWSGEVRSIVYSSDGKSVSVIYRVTLHGTDAEYVTSSSIMECNADAYKYTNEILFQMIYREATGTSSADDTGYGDPVQKAEAMAFRRACARLGLGLHLYHEDMS